MQFRGMTAKEVKKALRKVRKALAFKKEQRELKAILKRCGEHYVLLVQNRAKKLDLDLAMSVCLV